MKSNQEWFDMMNPEEQKEFNDQQSSEENFLYIKEHMTDKSPDFHTFIFSSIFIFQSIKGSIYWKRVIEKYNSQ